MEYTIRKAQKADAKQIFELIVELAIFEKEPGEIEINYHDIIFSGFKKNPDFKCFVAEEKSNIIGIALVYNRFSTWKGKILHLEDLIVSEKLRGNGIGSALFDTVVRYATKIGVKRVSWEVLNWNNSAIKFYESKGAEIKKDWNVVHLNELGIKNYLLKINR